METTVRVQKSISINLSSIPVTRTYRVKLDQPGTLHDIFVRCQKDVEMTIQIGFFSINVVEPLFQLTNQLVQSMDQCSDGSCVLKFSKTLLEDNDSTIILVLIRDAFECYRLLGATHKNFFNISSSNIELWKTNRSTMIIRQYDLDSLKLLNEQFQI